MSGLCCSRTWELGPPVPLVRLSPPPLCRDLLRGTGKSCAVSETLRQQGDTGNEVLGALGSAMQGESEGGLTRASTSAPQPTHAGSLGKFSFPFLPVFLLLYIQRRCVKSRY